GGGGDRPERPLPRKGWTGYPASGTSCDSILSPPANSTVAPLARSAPATASAGTTCPAVPPAAISTRGLGLLGFSRLHILLRAGARLGSLRGYRAGVRHVQQHPY